MPTEGALEVFLKAKTAILDELYGKYGVPRIDASVLMLSNEVPTGEGRFAEVFEVSLVSNDDFEKTESANYKLSGLKTVAAKVMKEDRIDHLLASIPPSPGATGKDGKTQLSAEKLLNYYKRECVVWQKCSGDPNKARENNLVELLGLVESYQDSYLPVLVSRFISEGTISSYIKCRVKPSLSDKHRILIVSDIANALSFLHEIGIVHRDINPHNILIENTGERYIGLLGDFGSSKELEGDLLQNLSSTLSQSRYSPPEYLVVRGAQHEDKGSGDIWSLGCSFLEILQEEEPWRPYLPEYFKQKLHEYQFPMTGESVQSNKPMTFRHVDDRCYEVMKKCWSKDKMERISAADLRDELLRLAEFV